VVLSTQRERLRIPLDLDGAPGRERGRRGGLRSRRARRGDDGEEEGRA